MALKRTHKPNWPVIQTQASSTTHLDASCPTFPAFYFLNMWVLVDTKKEQLTVASTGVLNFSFYDVILLADRNTALCWPHAQSSSSSVLGSSLDILRVFITLLRLKQVEYKYPIMANYSFQSKNLTSQLFYLLHIKLHIADFPTFHFSLGINK